MHRLVSAAIFILLLLPVPEAQTQSYELVAPGSRYLCGYMPDGTNLIFINGGSNDQPIAARKAIASVKKEIAIIEGRISRLVEIKRSLKDGVLSKSETKTLVRMSNMFETGPLPPSSSERKAAVLALIARLKLEVKNRRAEIDALQECDKNKRPKPPENSLEYEVIKFKALDGVYIAVIMYVPFAYNPNGDPYPQRWYCIQGTLEPRGQPRLFTQNPCFGGTPPFPGNSCTQFNHGGKHAAFLAFRIFQGPSWELNDPAVIAAEIEFREKHAGGAVGRPRTSLADNCQTI